ncbi:MAG: potassium transporter TrkG [Syntrophomonas sp.]|nr:potassium transporter TrkG [Syntrophomonas sp.]
MNKKPKYGQLLLAAYAGIGLLGALLLMLPWASNQPGTSFLQAWFTSMSALTVTGLTIVNTGSHWSLGGQVIILCLIQLGGLGLMVVTTVLLVTFGYRLNLSYRVIASLEQKQFEFRGIGTLFRNITLLVLAIEFIGTILLYFALPDMGDKGIIKVLFFALFHAVSAFNGSGLDITGVSLIPFRDLAGVNLVIMVMILLGSLGYVVLLELIELMRHWRNNLSLHSRLVLMVTVLITLGGSSFYLLAEYNSSLAGLPWSQKIIESLFQCITRTAGFVTVPVSSWNESFQFLMIIMMLIGTSPGSVGGGIKTTTFGVIILAAWAIARGKKAVVFNEREIEPASIAKAFTVTIMALVLVCIGTLTIMLIEQLPFMPVLFEVVSALATAGLSMGITEQMSSVGLAIISVFMFIGRIGVLSLVLILAKAQEDNIRYMKESIFID